MKSRVNWFVAPYKSTEADPKTHIEPLPNRDRDPFASCGPEWRMWIEAVIAEQLRNGILGKPTAADGKLCNCAICRAARAKASGKELVS